MDSPGQRSTKQRVPIHQLTIKSAFDGLSSQEKCYAHHMSRYRHTFPISTLFRHEADDFLGLKCSMARHKDHTSPGVAGIGGHF